MLENRMHHSEQTRLKCKMLHLQMIPAYAALSTESAVMLGSHLLLVSLCMYVALLFKYLFILGQLGGL